MDTVARRAFQVIMHAKKIAPHKPENGAFQDMNFRSLICVGAGLAAVAIAAGAGAADGDAAAGARKNSMCIGCHGIPGYKTAFPEVYSVPKLGAQQASYILKAL